MSTKQPYDYLEHIEQAIHNALIFIEGLMLEDFLEDIKTQQACTMNLLIIGEAATKLMNEFPDFVEQHPQIAWRNMRGMRNRIAHGYFDIDLTVVWETLQTALPDLQRKISEINSINCRS